MTSVLIIAPHPDDETLGCGGTLLRRSAEGAALHWLIVTTMTTETGFDPARIDAREREIETVAAAYSFETVRRLPFPTTRLDTVPLGDLVSNVAAAMDSARPEEILLPFPGDAHTDHRVTAAAVGAAAKTFRRPFVRRILAYETLSETDAALSAGGEGFRPTVFIDIETYLDEKVRILSLYDGEMGTFPFPRSEQAVRSLAAIRGAACGCAAAEAFVLLREVER